MKIWTQFFRLAHVLNFSIYKLYVEKRGEMVYSVMNLISEPLARACILPRPLTLYTQAWKKLSHLPLKGHSPSIQRGILFPFSWHCKWLGGEILVDSLEESNTLIKGRFFTDILTYQVPTTLGARQAAVRQTSSRCHWIRPPQPTGPLTTHPLWPCSPTRSLKPPKEQKIQLSLPMFPWKTIRYLKIWTSFIAFQI